MKEKEKIMVKVLVDTIANKEDVKAGEKIEILDADERKY